MNAWLITSCTRVKLHKNFKYLIHMYFVLIQFWACQQQFREFLYRFSVFWSMAPGIYNSHVSIAWINFRVYKNMFFLCIFLYRRIITVRWCGFFYSVTNRRHKHFQFKPERDRMKTKTMKRNRNCQSKNSKSKRNLLCTSEWNRKLIFISKIITFRKARLVGNISGTFPLLLRLEKMHINIYYLLVRCLLNMIWVG